MLLTKETKSIFSLNFFPALFYTWVFFWCQRKWKKSFLWNNKQSQCDKNSMAKNEIAGITRSNKMVFEFYGFNKKKVFFSSENYLLILFLTFSLFWAVFIGKIRNKAPKHPWFARFSYLDSKAHKIWRKMDWNCNKQL